MERFLGWTWKLTGNTKTSCRLFCLCFWIRIGWWLRKSCCFWKLLSLSQEDERQFYRRIRKQNQNQPFLFRASCSHYFCNFPPVYYQISCRCRYSHFHGFSQECELFLYQVGKWFCGWNSYWIDWSNYQDYVRTFAWRKKT